MKTARHFFRERWPALGLFAFLGWMLWVVLGLPPAPQHKVEAQGQGQNTFTLKFSAPVSASPTIVPACSETVIFTGSNCIPNVNQVADSITFSFSGLTVGSCGVNFPYLEFDGSNDGTNWFILAAATAIPSGSNTQSGSLVSNGWYSFKRLVYAGGPTCHVSVTGTYAGYGVTVPIGTNTTYTLVTFLVGSVFPALQPTDPVIIQGFQCTNPNDSAAFLQLGNYNNAFLGASSKVQIGLATGANYSYTGPPITLFGAASSFTATAWNGSSAAASGLECTFELNLSGSYSPNFPLSSF